MKYQVYIIEDHPQYQKDIQKIFESQNDFVLAGMARSVTEAMSYLKDAYEIDCILLDIGLPDMDGIEAIKLLKNLMPETAVIILSVFDDDNRIFTALKNGASGYLIK